MKVPYNYLPSQFEDFDSYIPDLRELVASGIYIRSVCRKI